ncbi:MAG TPA: NfeD family protein [Chloroflexota bacterium]|jgi:membrane-bound ClpP family serine protease|nr:NfeD family protein [Chloroflexota bacterium]
MILAIVLLLLAALGVLPLVVAAPLAIAGITVGGTGGFVLQRRMMRVPVENGTEAMIGTIGIALTVIERDGQLRVGNEIWSARTGHGVIRPGEPIRIVGIDGLRALVVPVDSTAGG